MLKIYPEVWKYWPDLAKVFRKSCQVGYFNASECYYGGGAYTALLSLHLQYTCCINIFTYKLLVGGLIGQQKESLCNPGGMCLCFSSDMNFFFKCIFWSCRIMFFFDQSQ